MNTLTSLQNDISSANSALDNTGAKMRKFNDTFQGIKRKRDEQVEDLQNILKKRNSLAGKLDSLSKEQSDLYQLLNAVNTLPENPNPKRTRQTELERLNGSMTDEQKALAERSSRSLRPR